MAFPPGALPFNLFCAQANANMYMYMYNLYLEERCSEVIKTVHEADLQKWTQDQKKKAMELIESANRISEEMFENGNITPYMDVLSRLDQYDYLNLLLICRQYPDAACLASFKQWAAMLPYGVDVLRPEWRGKGLDLLVPFTDFSSGKAELLWFAIKQFDISMTYVMRNTHKEAPCSVAGESCRYLKGAFRHLLSAFFSMSIIYEEKSTKSAPSQIGENTLKISECLPDSNQVYLLIEYFIRLCFREKKLDPALTPYAQLLISCVAYCLFILWHLPLYFAPIPNRSRIQQIPAEHQMLFLAALQRAVRYLDENISSTYSVTSSADSSCDGGGE